MKLYGQVLVHLVLHLGLVFSKLLEQLVESLFLCLSLLLCKFSFHLVVGSKTIIQVMLALFLCLKLLKEVSDASPLFFNEAFLLARWYRFIGAA